MLTIEFLFEYQIPNDFKEVTVIIPDPYQWLCKMVWV